MKHIVPHDLLTITYRSPSIDHGHQSERIQVVEVGLADFLEHCTGRIFDTHLAEASVRLLDDNNRFERRAPPGWLNTLDDDSVEAVIKSSNKHNITATRAKKAAALSEDWLIRVGAQSPTLPKSSAPGVDTANSSQPTATISAPPSTTPAASS